MVRTVFIFIAKETSRRAAGAAVVFQMAGITGCEHWNVALDPGAREVLLHDVRQWMARNVADYTFSSFHIVCVDVSHAKLTEILRTTRG